MAADTYIVHWPAMPWTFRGRRYTSPERATIETEPGQGADVRAEGPFTNAQARQILAEQGFVEAVEYDCEFFRP